MKKVLKILINTISEWKKGLYEKMKEIGIGYHGEEKDKKELQKKQYCFFN